MDFIGWLFPIIIVSIIFNAISKAAKRASTQQKQNPVPGQKFDLQEVLRQKVNEYQKKAEEFQNTFSKPAGMGNVQQSPVYTDRPSYKAPDIAAEGAPLNRYSSEGTLIDSNTMEGADLGRSSLEGTEIGGPSLEGIALENTLNPDRITPTETSGNYSANRRHTTGKRVIHAGNAFINQDSVLNGVIMSEVLQSRGGKRRSL